MQVDAREDGPHSAGPRSGSLTRRLTLSRIVPTLVPGILLGSSLLERPDVVNRGLKAPLHDTTLATRGSYCLFRGAVNNRLDDPKRSPTPEFLDVVLDSLESPPYDFFRHTCGLQTSRKSPMVELTTGYVAGLIALAIVVGTSRYSIFATTRLTRAQQSSSVPRL